MAGPLHRTSLIQIQARAGWHTPSSASSWSSRSHLDSVALMMKRQGVRELATLSSRASSRIDRQTAVLVAGSKMGYCRWATGLHSLTLSQFSDPLFRLFFCTFCPEPHLKAIRPIRLIVRWRRPVPTKRFETEISLTLQVTRIIVVNAFYRLYPY